MDLVHHFTAKRRPRLWPVTIACAASVLAAMNSPACAQAPPTSAAPATVVPAATYWKQDVFLIPYNGSANAGSGAAQAVRLLISTDHGKTSQTICEGKPNVKAFNYRARGDGEYWFAVRTIDAAGRTWPAGPYQPELRVIVDKTAPAIGECTAIVLDDGTLQLRWAATDSHLDANSWWWEVQAEGATTWDRIALANTASTTPGASVGSANWKSPSGRRAVAVRAAVFDLAGNSATANAAVARGAAGTLAAAQAPAPTAPQWTSATVGLGLTAAATSNSSAAPPDRPETQAWPASLAAHAPYHVFDNMTRAPIDSATRYGNPPRTNSPDDESQVARLEPFRQVSIRRLPPTGNEATNVEQGAGSKEQGTDQRGEGFEATSVPQNSMLHAPSSTLPAAKRVGSRTFELDYQLENVGRWGVSRVELWGTRNGGQTWRRYAEDEDLRSPVRVTVDDEGRYGFCIVAEAAGGTPAAPPQPGNQPELWVEVDLHRPFAELTSITSGTGNQADQLVLRWRAGDDNLEDRPISLFYSSRPVGPWSAIATSLKNSGEYAWRVERHVPDRFYVRLEARDVAGNLGAYQTIEPVQLESRDPTARLRTVAPADAEASSARAVQR